MADEQRFSVTTMWKYSKAGSPMPACTVTVEQNDMSYGDMLAVQGALMGAFGGLTEMSKNDPKAVASA